MFNEDSDSPHTVMQVLRFFPHVPNKLGITVSTSQIKELNVFLKKSQIQRLLITLFSKDECKNNCALSLPYTSMHCPSH